MDNVNLDNVVKQLIELYDDGIIGDDDIDDIRHSIVLALKDLKSHVKDDTIDDLYDAFNDMSKRLDKHIAS
jgi:hypothetical protein